MLGVASDWSLRVGNLFQPLRSTTQIWVVTRHQYGISVVVSKSLFRGETSGGVAKCRLFSQPNTSNCYNPLLFVLFFPQGTEDKSLLAGYVAMFLEKYNTAQVCGLDTLRRRSYILVVCG